MSRASPTLSRSMGHRLSSFSRLFGGGPRRRSGLAQHPFSRRGDVVATEKAQILAQLLNPVPTTATALSARCAEFNQHCGTNFTLQDLDPDGLNMADPRPEIDDQTDGVVSALTKASFVVAATAGDFATFTSVGSKRPSRCWNSKPEGGLFRRLDRAVRVRRLEPIVKTAMIAAIAQQRGARLGRQFHGRQVVGGPGRMFGDASQVVGVSLGSRKRDFSLSVPQPPFLSAVLHVLANE